MRNKIIYKKGKFGSLAKEKKKKKKKSIAKQRRKSWKIRTRRIGFYAITQAKQFF